MPVTLQKCMQPSLQTLRIPLCSSSQSNLVAMPFTFRAARSHTPAPRMGVHLAIGTLASYIAAHSHPTALPQLPSSCHMVLNKVCSALPLLSRSYHSWVGLRVPRIPRQGSRQACELLMPLAARMQHPDCIGVPVHDAAIRTLLRGQWPCA